MSVLLDGQPDAGAIEALLAGETIHAALLLELRFRSGAIYLSNENVPFVDTRWGRTWRGMGDLVGMSDVAAGPDDLAPFREYMLAIPWELLTEDERGVNGMGRIPGLIGERADFYRREANLYLQLFDDTLRNDAGRPAPVGFPMALDSGLMDRVIGKYTPDAAILTLSVEGLLARKGAPVFGFLTDRDQKKRHPGDNGLRYVTEVVTTFPVWTDW